jgi:hypothetical protein
MKDDRMSKYIGIGIALGSGIGTALGVVFDNIAIGISMGISLGVAIGAGIGKVKQDRGFWLSHLKKKRPCGPTSV